MNPIPNRRLIEETITRRVYRDDDDEAEDLPDDDDDADEELDVALTN